MNEILKKRIEEAANDRYTDNNTPSPTNGLAWTRHFLNVV